MGKHWHMTPEQEVQMQQIKAKEVAKRTAKREAKANKKSTKAAKKSKK